MPENSTHMFFLGMSMSMCCFDIYILFFEKPPLKNDSSLSVC